MSDLPIDWERVTFPPGTTSRSKTSVRRAAIKDATVTKARYPGKCQACGYPIKVGQTLGIMASELSTRRKRFFVHAKCALNHGAGPP